MMEGNKPMTLPDNLLQLQQEALAAVRTNPEGMLPLSWRMRMWAALGPMQREGTRATRSVGHRRRTVLALLCAKHVLAIWENEWPQLAWPHEAMQAAEDYLSDKIDFETARTIARRCYTNLENFSPPKSKYYTIYAAFAAVGSLNVALHDEEFDPEEIDENLSDRDLDDWDPAFYAACAYAGSFPWGDSPDPSKPQEFWEWYLQMAIPQAWDSVE